MTTMRTIVAGLAIVLVAATALAREPEAARAASDGVGAGVDRVLVRAETAADAASIVLSADALRRRGHDALAAGRRDEARALLRQAG
jgi:hypothetical protein